MQADFFRQYKWLFWLAIFLGGYCLGIQQAYKANNAEMAKIKQHYADETGKANEAYLQTLQQAQQQVAVWQDKANQINHEVLSQSTQAKHQAEQYKQDINNAIRQDHSNYSCVDGLGANSLHQYRRALGYD